MALASPRVINEDLTPEGAEGPSLLFGGYLFFCRGGVIRIYLDGLDVKLTLTRLLSRPVCSVI